MRSSHAHLAVEALASWQVQGSPASEDQIRYAYHLATGCERCWSALGKMRPAEPRRLTDPFLRTVARVCLHPRVDLALPSQAARLFIDARFQPYNLPLLLLQETIALGSDFSLVMDLAKLLSDTPDMNAVAVDLRVDIDCAASARLLQVGDIAQAEAALQSAKRHFESCCRPSTQTSIALVEFKLACSSGKDLALERMESVLDTFPRILNDPVRRFEVRCELLLGINGSLTENPTVATWALSELTFGPRGHEIQRLNGLIHQAQFAKLTASVLPQLPFVAANDLEESLGAVRLYGDLYSLAVWYQLLGELRAEESHLDDALSIYANLELEIPFRETWKAHERLLVGDWQERDQFRSRTSNLAYSVFGKDSAQRMAREVSESLASRSQCGRGDQLDPCTSETDQAIGVEVG